MLTRKRAKAARQDAISSSIGPFARLPDCLLSLVFGCLSWQFKLAVLNLVSRKWRRTRAAWTTLSLAKHKDCLDERNDRVKTRAHLETIIAQAQTCTLRALTTHYSRTTAWLGVVIEPAVNLELVTLKQDLVPSTFIELVRILQTRAQDAPLALSLSLIGHTDREFKAFAQLLSMATVRRLQFREFDGTLSLWSKALGASLTELGVNGGLKCLDFLQHLSGLRVLDLSYCTEIRDEHLLALPRDVPRLEQLDLCCCSRITDTAVSTALVHMNQLAHLNLRRTRVTEDSVKHLIRCNLGAMVRGLNFHGSMLRLKSPDWWARLIQLETLNLGDCDLEDADLACLQGLRTLHYLNLRANFRLQGTGFVHLTTLPLHSLDLAECFELRSLDHLCQPSLRVLNLERLRVGTSINKKRFFSICLQGVLGLEELSLAATLIKDAYLPQFLVLTRLRRFNLRSCCYLTDAAFATLAKFPCLTNVCVEGTMLTQAKEQSLRDKYEFF